MNCKRIEHGFWFFVVLSALVHGTFLYMLLKNPLYFRESGQEPKFVQVELQFSNSLGSGAGIIGLDRLKPSSDPFTSSPPRLNSLMQTRLPTRIRSLPPQKLAFRLPRAPSLNSILFNAPSLEDHVSEASTPKAGNGTGVYGKGTGGGIRLGGIGSGMPNIMSGYLSEIRKLIENKRRYPLVSRRALQEGTAKVGFCILKVGALNGKPELIASSGYAALDRAALDCVQDASPFPPIPSEIDSQDLELNLNIVFQLKE
jgi:TonB family protein